MRGLIALASLAAGLLLGVVGAFFQAMRLSLFGWTVPYGLLLMLAFLLILIRSVIEAADVRWPGWLVYVGWLAATVVYAAELPSGSLVISAGGRQMGYLAGGVVLGAAAATVPSLNRLRTARAPRPAGVSE